MIEQSKYLREAMELAIAIARNDRVEFLCPEHVLAALLIQTPFKQAVFYELEASEKQINSLIYRYLSKMERVPQGIDYELQPSVQLNQVMNWAFQAAEGAQVTMLDVPHIINAMYFLEDSMAQKILKEAIPCSRGDLFSQLVTEYEICAEAERDFEGIQGEAVPSSDETAQSEPWLRYASCMADSLEGRPAIVGRDEELDRTLQVLCRLEKNNPLHVGEPGVGKTALVWGLAQRLYNNDVPQRLQGYTIYELDLGALVAGAQFRGDLEKRLKGVMEALSAKGKVIVYIDNIHNLIGAGQNGDSAMDATQILRPYMEQSDVRFIGSTTYQDLTRHLQKQRGLLRLFQQIEVKEPSEEEALLILRGLQSRFEQHHGVRYDDEALRYAVEMSARHIAERCLPDKAIDLIDEAGAWLSLHPQTRMRKGSPVAKKTQTVSKAVIADQLTRLCKVNAEALRGDDNSALRTLAKRMKALIYGQDEAINHVVGAVEMAKAGLLDEEKPLASLLFVGPTGVGKTEVARVLARELGIELVRFDMSEYTEKHTVAKLIGSPAGYVGYEDGGLLTDAIRKTPNCVLLLDEIEKAHSDIYNILLQVMDYGRLTDNRGNKADFHNVILIMTSNAGAQYAGQASIGFGGGVTAGQAMLSQVKKTFKPEFINRLSGTVVFHDMDRTMASLILDKKLSQLQTKLTQKSVTLKLDDAARQLLLERGFTRQYGAREMDRVIQQMLSPLLMREILYGKLRKGGEAHITVTGDSLEVKA